MEASLRALLRAVPILGLGVLAGCGERDKTTAAADARRPPVLLQFDGYVYVPVNTSDFKLLERVRAQTRSVFTGLRRSRVMVSRREVQGPSAESFTREAVTVVDAATGKRELALRVRYRYVARPEVANRIGDREELALALLHREDDTVAERVMEECAATPERSRGNTSAISIDFDPSLPRCKAAIEAEQAAIDAARAKVLELAGAAPDAAEGAVVPVEEVRRVYLPVTVTLERRARQRREIAPRYVPLDRPEEAPAVAGAEGAGADEELAPARVIIDPDLSSQRTPEEQALKAEGALLPESAAGQGRGASRAERRSEADVAVMSPAVVQAQQRKAEPTNERFEIPFETLADPKFLVVWLSLLMAYPILRGDPRGRKRG
ncbi:hypothetical protein SOCEGT47_083710 [Sorangium cellulosum]|uniref:Uncharacterized protein n=1 Tax=Sorangium cellulosum TaxID=56 RepID=A0A4P2QF04_SORCE|nr:hypothetical protein [Sorangium cellulosum]AUX27773.1 hypothetical protein SOCEGT47_083710 [Sorangium cellulosum]